MRTRCIWYSNEKMQRSVHMDNNRISQRERVCVPDVIYDKTVNGEAAAEISLADYLPEKT